jgi:hypothetical protein
MKSATGSSGERVPFFIGRRGVFPKMRPSPSAASPTMYPSSPWEMYPMASCFISFRVDSSARTSRNAFRSET